MLKDYTINNARYNMCKLKGKQFVDKIEKKRKYQAMQKGIQIMSAELCVFKQELKPLFTIVHKNNNLEIRPSQEPTLMRIYF